MTKLDIMLSAKFGFPDEAVTQTFAILAKRGAGKSNTAAVMAEGMAAAKLPFVVVDPVGAWWGLRSSADGKSEGLPIPIFGGYRGDIPLEPSAGHLIADLIVNEQLSCVLDVSAFESENSKRRFLADFAEQLFRAKGRPGADFPLHLFLEEADDYAPQKAMRDAARCLGAFQRIVKQGRARGLGATMITQRSAVLNKDLLTQIETLIVMRTTSPQDRKAIGGWLEYHANEKDVLGSLSSLKDGEAWVWSAWLGVMERVQVRRRTTFDSGATPSIILRNKRPPATLTDIDLSAIEAQMKETIERAKEEDPVELKRRIRELEDITKRMAKVADVRPIVQEVEVEVAPKEVTEAVRIVLADAPVELRNLADDVRRIAGDIDKRLAAAWELLRNVRPVEKTATARPVVSPVHTPAGEAPPSRPVSSSTDLGSKQKILDAIAFLIELGQDNPRREAVALVSGFAMSGTFKTYLSALKTSGYITYPSDGRLALTELGRATAKDSIHRLNEDSLREIVYVRVGASKTRILKRLVAMYPRSIDREQLAQDTGFEMSGTFKTYLSSLRTMGLIDYPTSGTVAATSALFVNP